MRIIIKMDRRQEVIQAVEEGFNNYKENLTEKEQDIIRTAILLLESDPSEVRVSQIMESVNDLNSIHNEHDIQSFPGYIFNAKNGKVALTYSLLDLLRNIVSEPYMRIPPEMIMGRCSSKEEIELRMTSW